MPGRESQVSYSKGPASFVMDTKLNKHLSSIALRAILKNKEAKLVARCEVNSMDHFHLWAKRIVATHMFDALDLDNRAHVKWANDIHGRDKTAYALLLREVTTKAYNKLKGKKARRVS